MRPGPGPFGPASVSAATKKGPRRENQDRFFTNLSTSDDSFVIAVADGLGGHARGAEAAQAAIEEFPGRIADRDEMVEAFVNADERVTALSASIPDSTPLSVYPMTTLCVAAWTPEGGLLVAWMGDTLAYSTCWTCTGTDLTALGDPHRSPRGSLTKCLGMPERGFKDVASEMECQSLNPPVTGIDQVVICSDGAWEAAVRLQHGKGAHLGRLGPNGHRKLFFQNFWDEGTEDSSSEAEGILLQFSHGGLGDNATVAVASLPAAVGATSD